MNELSHETGGRGIRPRTRRVPLRKAPRRPMPHLHSHGVAQDAGRRGRGERIHAMHELHRALANVTRTGDEQLRGEAAQIVAEATSRLNGLLATDR